MTEVAEQPLPPLAFSYPDWARLLLAVAASAFVCLLVCDLAGVPAEPAFNGSLLAGTQPIKAVAATVAVVVLCSGVGAAFAAFLGAEAGLFASCGGLIALAVRCGTVRSTLQFAAGPGVFLTMAVECLLLLAILLAVTRGVEMLFRNLNRGHDPLAVLARANETADPTPAENFATLGVQVAVTAIVEQILVQTDVKMQALAGAAVAAYLGAIAAYLYQPSSRAIWYWAGPLAVGTLGNVLAFLTGDRSPTGEVHGWAAALVRPIPMDYAVATGAALAGFWMIRRWEQPEELVTTTETSLT